jgi:hypothetical protein
MTELQATEAIFARFIAQWPGLSSNVPYATENVPLPEPAATVFARIQIDRLDSEQHVMGGVGVRKWERPGWIDVLLVGPMNVGAKQLIQLGQHVRTIFEGVRFANAEGEHGIHTLATSIRAVRNHPEYPGCAVVVARTPFAYFETR